jgi:hypothetical protein
MTVVAKGEGQLTAEVREEALPLVREALNDYAGVARDSLDHARDEHEGEQFHARLAAIAELQSQLEGATSLVSLTGPEELVVSAVKAAVSIATHDLDTHVGSLTTERAPLSRHGREDLDTRTTRVATCVETLIACEDSRQHG